MKYQIKEGRNRVVILTLTGLLVLVFILAISNCITGALAWHFYRTHKTITTPMMFDRAFVSDSATGDQALNGMLVRSFVNLRLSVTPETVKSQHSALLRYVPPEYRDEMKKQLDAEAEYINKNGVTSVFRIDDEITDTTIVVFMQRGCQYSAKFDPKLSEWAKETGIKVYPYTLDGYGDNAFPVAIIPRKVGPNEPIAGEILTFFGNGLPIATPTTFMVNVNTNMAYPLYQGDTDMSTISQRLAQMIEADIDHLAPDTLGPVPRSASLTAQ